MSTMSATKNGKSPRKVCFVTIGATAGFDSLITASLSTPFLEALRALSYTDLRLQHGKYGRSILEEHNNISPASTGMQELNISGFDFKKQGLGVEMKAVKGGSDSFEGVVISHAGSGSILDALRIALPLIVVPNPSLLDNHQEELAEELARQGYVVHGHLNDLPAALRLSESLRKTQHTWPPSNHAEDPSGKGLIGVMDDELGFVD